MIRLQHIAIRLFKILVLAFLVCVLALAGFLGYLATARNTQLELPRPTGSYPVGRLELDWVDAARPDPLSNKGNSPRELLAWVWYPAADKKSTPAPYLPPDWVRIRDQDQGVGILVESNFNRIRTHSFTGVPLAAAPRTFPVLIMEPGMGPMATDYTTFAENLASHGYVVLGIQPTETSNWTVFPDGRYVPRSAKGTIPDSDSPAQFDADASRILAVWAQDVEFALDQLSRINTDPAGLFQNRLDLDHIGIWGHSFGGATALAVCQKDARCKAGVDIDGTPWGDTVQLPVLRPFMWITEDYSKGCDRDCELMRESYLHIQPGAAYSISVTGARHFNFSDLPFRQLPVLRPLFRLVRLDGSIQPARALAITNAYLVAFFDQSLKGMKEALLQSPSPAYPEVNFEKH